MARTPRITNGANASLSVVVDGDSGNDGGANEATSSTENGDDGTVNPASLIGGSGNDSGTDEYVRNSDGSIARNKDGSLKRKRGRKAGSRIGGQSRQAGNPQDLKGAIDSLAAMIGFVHIGIASVSKCPELLLEDSESQALAGATAKVMEQFDVTPDPRVTAIVGLMTTAGTIYGPRYFVIRSRLKEERKKDNVVQFPVPPNGGNTPGPSDYNFQG